VLTVVGFGAIAISAWLMMFKPFQSIHFPAQGIRKL
jgi:hypothetical protein